MKIYLVGGCVRDQLLGIEAGDRDWVVVGATDSEMKRKGFKKVGAHFPVYLHPQTKEEYALARLEKKQGQGYHGFSVEFDSSVTLEDDLMRRDLTINAIAFDPVTKEYIDPFQGQHDLHHKILRHVSPAFADDPLRLVRLARFAAFFPDMMIAPETEQMVKKIVESGELLLLPTERITLEIEKNYSKSKNVARFWALLYDWGALKQIMQHTQLTEEQWLTLRDALSDVSSFYPQIRYDRALAQVIERSGSHVWQSLTQSLSVSNKQQKRILLLVSWRSLTRQFPIAAEMLLNFLKQFRLFQQFELLDDLQPLLQHDEHPHFLKQLQAFVHRLAEEAPRAWLEHYPPQERRFQLESYYVEQIKKTFNT